MKFGVRKPSLKKSISAQTTGRAKRTFKRAVNPLYGKKGMGWVNNPKKATYNKVYQKTTVSSKGCTGCLTACIYYPIYWSFLLLFLCCKWVLIGIISLFVLLFNCLLWIIEKIYNAIVKAKRKKLAPEIIRLADELMK